MEILNVKVERDTKDKLERLVKIKGYKNKSEALRRLIDEHFKEHPEVFAGEDLDEIVREAERISDEDYDRIASDVFKGKGKRKTAAEIVAEGRER